MTKRDMDLNELNRRVSAARAETERPSLIVIATHIGPRAWGVAYMVED